MKKGGYRGRNSFERKESGSLELKWADYTTKRLDGTDAYSGVQGAIFPIMCLQRSAKCSGEQV
jgi:hypothetical protein